MNDRFKFRVYNKRLQKMYDVRSMSEYQGSIVRIEVDDYDENNEYKHLIFDDYEKMIDDCILLQCTGLKDRNGKLIYEGDILNVNTGSRDTSGIGEVVYLQCGCRFVLNGFLENPSGYYPRRKGEFHIDLQEWLCTEVIGNIYTTPELLGEQC